MRVQKDLRAALIGLGALLLTSQAHSTAITDVSVYNSVGGLNSPSAIASLTGNAKKAKINALTGLFTGDSWTMLDKTNKPSKHVMDDALFTLTADVKQRSGAWNLSWTGTDLAAYMDFVLVMKAGKQWGAYLFEAGSISSVSGSVDGLYEMSWLNKHGKVAKFRRAFIYGRLTAIPDAPDGDLTGSGDDSPGSGDGNPALGDGNPTPGDSHPTLGDGNPTTGDGNPASGGDGLPDQNPNAIPTPGSLVLIILGLGLVGLRQWRQRR